ncbi:MAG: hypothetical protein IKZ86_08895 [Spirochaetaceae bacterium]|nr:hypothetical protein [Spirochaetaceae bacterium]
MKKSPMFNSKKLQQLVAEFAQSGKAITNYIEKLPQKQAQFANEITFAKDVLLAINHC